MRDDKFSKPYKPGETESRIYDIWEKSGFFNPDVAIEKGVTAPDAPVFSMVLPPPNVTGTLHIGHAFEDTLQDIATRFNRMSGKKTLWIPGTDHAAIATQSKVEKLMEKEGLRRKDLGREKFLERVREFADESRKNIDSQVRKMGASLDWSREAFTLDEKREVAVRTAFKKLYDLGLIYRGHKVVNWDPKGQTVISDDEVNHEEREATLYTFKYEQDFPIAISTTRPETKIGDTGVAVHPDDARYKEYIGKTYDLKFAGVPLSIKVVADESVDPEFGTGALGVTPAHSQVDSEIAERHGLKSVQVIDERARIVLSGDLELKDKKTTEARELIVDWMRKENLLIKEEKTIQNISVAERSGGIIEPLPKTQWFIAVNKTFKIEHSEINGILSGSETTLKEIMRSAVSNRQVKIIPENFEKIYFHWIDNLRDWCISRQLWYGHRIPVWYRGSEIFIGENGPEGEGWSQEEDTLDTWFSSGLWTFSTLGWPEKTPDLKTYHPTSLLMPGYEILFFWVARMILMGGALLGQVPFDTVYIHGMVRDKKGQKFSKSLGNGIEPLDVIAEYGADALRMALIVGVGPGSDSKFDPLKVGAYKKFANKIWNAARFVLDNTEELRPDAQFEGEDAELLEEFGKVVQDITGDMNNLSFYLAAEKIYHYFWHTFADIIIEKKKKDEDKQILRKLLIEQLKILHPFMPFISEEIWGELPESKNLLMVEKWPQAAGL